MTATQRKCSECGQQLPRGWDWDVRSLAWLEGLPRRISPTNNDLEIHDGVQGRSRFLHLEFKPDRRELDKGQRWHLEAKSRLPNYTVLLIRGKRTDTITIERVFEGSWQAPIATDCERFRHAIEAWLRGLLWRDAAAALPKPAPVAPRSTKPVEACATCGRPPDFHYQDGSPGYRCSHAPGVPA